MYVEYLTLSLAILLQVKYWRKAIWLIILNQNALHLYFFHTKIDTNFPPYKNLTTNYNMTKIFVQEIFATNDVLYSHLLW